MSTPPQTLIEIDDSLFRKGYQEGRLRYFQQPSFFTDEDLVTRLVQAFESSTQQTLYRKEPMSTTRQTLVDLHHPTFRKGYQQGRQDYFREQMVFTDKMLVELLQCVFEQSQQDEAPEREEGVYYSIGQLVGKMSGCVIPRQPYEDRTQDLQEAFLVKVRQEYGTAGPALISTIRQFWATQDHLAERLDAETFEEMLRRGVEQGN